MQARSISGGIHFHGDGRTREAADHPPPRQLPADVGKFVNRVEELDRLEQALPDGANSGPTVYVIAGTAGVGKTSLALRWAHRAREHFPDGQLYVNLRGYDPGEPVGASEALHRFLVALGFPTSGIPTDTEAAAAMYRSELADRRVLVVLDNAASVSQVRPLLPAHSRCLTIVTSRGRLSGLSVHDGAQRLTVDTLSGPECVTLLRAVTASYRAEDDDDKLADLARLCASLPLALRIAGERAASHPHMRIEDLIADLRDQSALWDALSTGEEGEETAVRTVFAWSYRALSPELARLFRLLGLHPGPDFGIGVVRALAETSVRRARQLLDGLVAGHMLEQTATDRFEFHDLLRAYAVDEAHLEETPESRAGALTRVLDWYLYAADAARAWIMPARDRVALDARTDVPSPSFSDYDQAVDWAEREHSNFLPVVRAAREAGLDRHACQLALVLWSAKAPSAVVTEWLEIGRIGLSAAQRLGERAGEAALSENLGFTCVKTNQMGESLERHGRALELRRELGDSEGVARSLNALGMAHLRWRRLESAEANFRRARAEFHSLGSRDWDAVVLGNLATVHCQAGRLVEAHEQVQEAIAYHRGSGSKRGLGNALRLLSRIRLDLGEPHEALEAAEEAHDLALDLRSHVLEGYWLVTLGDVQQALGWLDEASVSYHRSAVLHRRLGDRSREALAWHGAGEVHRRFGRDEEAASFYRCAAAVQHELGYAWDEATALDGLAEVLRSTDAEQSRQRWREALGLLGEVDDRRTEAIRRRIDENLADLG